MVFKIGDVAYYFGEMCIVKDIVRDNEVTIQNSNGIEIVWMDRLTGSRREIYNCLEAAGGSWIVVGPGIETINGDFGFTQDQAEKMVFTLNCAFRAGQKHKANSIKNLLDC